MRKLDVLLLGWDFPPAVASDSGVACYELARELAGKVNLSLILPKADPQYTINNVELTGLNNVNLQETSQPVAKPGYQVFGHQNQSQPQQELKPYGAPTFTGQEELFTPTYEQPGEAESVGELGHEGTTAPGTPALAAPDEEFNIFGQTDFSQLDYNTQVIHFARYASRLASQKKYDIIYATDWMTYLAGIELKLVSGKILVVHVHSLCEDRGGPDSKGWAYELEKQALEKADFIIAHNENLVNKIEEQYAIPATKIRSLSKLDEPFSMQIPEEDEEPVAEEIAIEPTTPADPDLSQSAIATETTAEITEPLDWQEAAANMVTVFQKLVEKPKFASR
jgi:glycogen synthase